MTPDPIEELVQDALDPTEHVGSSLMDELSAAREELSQEKKPRDFPLPGYGDKLIARYRALDFDDLAKIQERGAKMAKSGDEEAAEKVMFDTLAEACVGMFTRQDGELVALEDATGLVDYPIRYDSNLATVLGFDVETNTARECVQKTIPNKVALVAHYADYGQYAASVNEAVDEDFLQGLPATPVSS